MFELLYINCKSKKSVRGVHVWNCTSNELSLLIVTFMLFYCYADNCILPGMYSIPNNCDNSLGSLTTPMSGDRQEMITAKSPHVQGSVHEECAWFTIEEAQIKSPVFEQIYHTEQFTQLLTSILTTVPTENR